MKKTILVLLCMVMCVFYGCSEKTTDIKPNVLFIFVDDLRPELGSYGASQVLTPHMDKLASQSLVFNNAYCNIPVCGASRASILSGILPTNNRFTNYLSRADEDAPNAKTLPQLFKEAGYTTASHGKVFHQLDDSQDKSWSEPAWHYEKDWLMSLDPETEKYLSEKKRGRIYEFPEVDDYAYHDGKTALKTIEKLKEFKASSEPFFIAAGFVKPHLPFYAPKKYWDLYDRDAITLADNRYTPKNAPDLLSGSSEFKNYYLDSLEINSEKFHRTMKHGYLACVSYVDQMIGDVLNELEETGLAENTIVVLWADHGWHLGEHNFWGKHNTMHLALKVPLMIRLPNQENGTRTNAIVESTDIYPTLCELAKIDIPEEAQGTSFSRLFDEPESRFREYAYSRYGKADAVVTDRYSFSLYDDEGNTAKMLYDHKIDPQENENVVDDEAYKDVAEQLQDLVEKSIRRAHTYPEN